MQICAMAWMGRSQVMQLVLDMSRQDTFLFYLPQLLKPKINTYLQ